MVGLRQDTKNAVEQKRDSGAQQSDLFSQQFSSTLTIDSCTHIEQCGVSRKENTRSLKKKKSHFSGPKNGRHVFSRSARIQFPQQLLNRLNHEKYQIESQVTLFQSMLIRMYKHELIILQQQWKAFNNVATNTVCKILSLTKLTSESSILHAQTVKMMHNTYNKTLCGRRTIASKSSNKTIGMDFCLTRVSLSQHADIK